MNTAPDLGYEFAPQNVGKYIVYDVDSIVYDDFYKDTTQYKYRVKEKLEENITDNQGRPSLRLVRYYKKFNVLTPYEQIQWTVKDVWYYTRTNTALEVVEENKRFVKLSFPVKQDAVWDGNAQNNNGAMNYKYLFIDLKQNINGTTFDNVLCVEQKDDKRKNAIRRQYYIEKYAKGVGLVYREITDLYSNTVIANVPVEKRIEKGIIYKLTYVTHGIE